MSTREETEMRCVWCGRTGEGVESFMAQGAEVGLCTETRSQTFFAGTAMETTETVNCAREVQSMRQSTTASEMARAAR